MTAARGIGGVYSNDTGKPIIVRVSGYSVGGTWVYGLYVNGFFAGQEMMSYSVGGGTYLGGASFLIPTASTYQLVCFECFGGGGLQYWHELR